MPSIVTSTTMPGRMGSAPSEVPQAITSPGASAISLPINSTIRAGGMIISESG